MKKNKLIYPFLSALILVVSAPISRAALTLDDLKNIKDLQTVFTVIINTILGLVGVVAVLFIIIGGIRYMTSSGNPDQIQGAKNSILYGIIGLVIVILAYVIVKFVIQNLTGAQV